MLSDIYTLQCLLGLLIGCHFFHMAWGYLHRISLLINLGVLIQLASSSVKFYAGSGTL